MTTTREPTDGFLCVHLSRRWISRRFPLAVRLDLKVEAAGESQPRGTLPPHRLNQRQQARLERDVLLRRASPEGGLHQPIARPAVQKKVGFTTHCDLEDLLGRLCRFSFSCRILALQPEEICDHPGELFLGEFARHGVARLRQHFTPDGALPRLSIDSSAGMGAAV